jgi:hypothetical protein
MAAWLPRTGHLGLPGGAARAVLAAEFFDPMLIDALPPREEPLPRDDDLRAKKPK